MAKIEYATFYLEWLVYALKKILNILLYIKYCKKRFGLSTFCIVKTNPIIQSTT